jgi:hypothetical protein
MKYLKLHEIFVCQSQDGWVGIATGYILDAKVSITDRDNFSLFHRVQTDSGAHPASYPKGTRAVFPGIKRPGHEPGQPHPSNTKVKNGGAILHSPCILMTWCLFN